MSNITISLIGLTISLLLSIILISINFLFSKRILTEDKLTAYECGFESFSDTRQRFEIHFYIIGILFILFDLEITFMLPWAVYFGNMTYLSIFSMVIFILLFFFGFLFEWTEEALDWVTLSS